MPELNYKASNIAKAERELNANFFTTLEGLGEGAPSFNSLLMILRAGGLTESEADDMLDNEGIEGALGKAVEALNNAGFLAKLKAQEAAPETKEASATSGKKTSD